MTIPYPLADVNCGVNSVNVTAVVELEATEMSSR